MRIYFDDVTLICENWKMVFALITDVENRICGLCRDYIPSG